MQRRLQLLVCPPYMKPRDLVRNLYPLVHMCQINPRKLFTSDGHEHPEHSALLQTLLTSPAQALHTDFQTDLSSSHLCGVPLEVPAKCWVPLEVPASSARKAHRAPRHVACRLQRGPRNDWYPLVGVCVPQSQLCDRCGLCRGWRGEIASLIMIFLVHLVPRQVCGLHASSLSAPNLCHSYCLRETFYHRARLRWHWEHREVGVVLLHSAARWWTHSTSQWLWGLG